MKNLFNGRKDVFFRHRYNGLGDCIVLAQPVVNLENETIKAAITMLKLHDSRVRQKIVGAAPRASAA